MGDEFIDSFLLLCRLVTVATLKVVENTKNLSSHINFNVLGRAELCFSGSLCFFVSTTNLPLTGLQPLTTVREHFFSCRVSYYSATNLMSRLMLKIFKLFLRIFSSNPCFIFTLFHTRTLTYISTYIPYTRILAYSFYSSLLLQLRLLLQ